MTKSTITREQLIKKAQEQIAFCRDTKVTGDGRTHVNQCAALFEIALAAMDSESWCLPLDYLQGHKDGLEWAAQLAEANHPETGDWLYDDPIELAKAIRKGPDMPPAQPAADSEPVAWMHNNNNIGIPAITTSQKIGQYWMSEFKDVQPLYRHAQPAPVVPEEKPIPNTLSMYAVDAVAAIAEVKGWNACRAAILAAAPQLPGSEPATVTGKWIPVSERMPGSQEWVIVFAKWANQQVLCWDDVQNRWTDFEDQSYYADMFSHWMPLPAAPQEVLDGK